MSDVKRFISEHPDWLVRLQAEYAIDVVTDGDLVSLKYNQIESPMRLPLVQECRGMVVHVPTGTVLAHPYNKFWNHGEPLAASLDWSTARVLEKLDGSLMTLYWHPFDEQWTVASSGTPRAGGSFGDEDTTFRDVFWATFNALGMRLPDDHRDACFMFELCTAGNRIVVRHDKPRLVLHGARDMASGEELGPDWLGSIGYLQNWEVVRSFELGSIDECLYAANELDPLQCEGFIVVDEAFRRVKIKSPRYVVLHHLKGNATPRRAIELWQTGEAGELLAHFPEMAPAILPVHEKLDRIAAIAAERTAEASTAPDRKAFAMAIKNEPWSSVAFKLYGAADANVDAAKQVMRASSLSALEKMLEGAA